MSIDILDQLIFSLKEEKKNEIFDLKEAFDQDSSFFIDNIDSLPIAVCLTDRYGMFMNVNQRYCQLYGYKKSELLGNHFSLVVPEPQRDFVSSLHTSFISGMDELAQEFEVVDKWESQKFVFCSASRVVVDGSPAKATFVVDITKITALRNRIIDELQNSLTVSRDKERAFEILIHDLNNFIYSIRMSANLMHGEMDRMPREATSLAVVIERNATRALELISYQSRLIQLQNNTYQSNFSSLIVLRELHEIIVDLQENIKANNLFIQWVNEVFNEIDGTILNDRFCFHYALRNILEMSIAQAERGSVITLKLQRRQNSFHIKIHYNPESEVSDKFSFGIAISRQMVTAMHGKLSIKSSKGYGTLVGIHLPDNQDPLRDK